ncbi:histidine kinase [Nocardia lijiangensis]|uniref:sensor histidine kinase n=1 Tax=Nocardia lijiangensis TaxID=299618 RepID=UPI003D73B9A4
MSAPGIANRGSVVWDWGLAIIVAIVQVAGSRGANMHQTGTESLDVLGYLLLIAGPVALLFRRTQPLPVLVITLAACGIYLALGYGYGPIFVSLVIAFLTAATIGSRWWTYPLAPIGYATFVWPLPALLGRSVNGWQIFGTMAWLTVLVGAAEGLRLRKVMLEARRQRVEAARRDEQAQRERRATEERLAIARELHDVLAHSLSLINVQSSVALELFDKKPQQARTALAAIKAASKESLAEVHTLLQTIRTGATLDDPEPEAVERNSIEAARPARGRRGVRRVASGERRESNANSGTLPRNAVSARKQEAPRAPAPSIGDLNTLLQRARDAGLAVETRVIGEPQKLPSVIDVAAARIIQESLTNVVRHAPGAKATVTVRYAAGSVDLTIDNTRPTAPVIRSGSSGGNGIIGMRERAHALGGALTAGPRPSGGFRVAARLPNQTAPVPRPAPRPAEPAPAKNGASAVLADATSDPERNGSAADSDTSSSSKTAEQKTHNGTASVAAADPNVRKDSAHPVPGGADATAGPHSGSTPAAAGDSHTAIDDRKVSNGSAAASAGDSDTSTSSKTTEPKPHNAEGSTHPIPSNADSAGPHTHNDCTPTAAGDSDTAIGERQVRNDSTAPGDAAPASDSNPHSSAPSGGSDTTET